MAARYTHTSIPETSVPRASLPWIQPALETYASETNKVASVWRSFEDDNLGYRPHERSSTVGEILKHQLLSERRFFAEFLGMQEPSPADVLPPVPSIAACAVRLVDLALPRLGLLATQSEGWWLSRVPFFDVERERLWIFWRRVLHTAHHRTQLTVYLRLLGRPVPATYGPTADVTWSGADPTIDLDAAGRAGTRTG